MKTWYFSWNYKFYSKDLGCFNYYRVYKCFPPVKFVKRLLNFVPEWKEEVNNKVLEFKWSNFHWPNVPGALVQPLAWAKRFNQTYDGSHLSHRLHTLGSLGFSDSLRPIRRPESSSRAELCKAGMILRRREIKKKKEEGDRCKTIFEQSRSAVKLFWLIHFTLCDWI